MTLVSKFVKYSINKSVSFFFPFEDEVFLSISKTKEWWCKMKCKKKVLQVRRKKNEKKTKC